MTDDTTKIDFTVEYFDPDSAIGQRFGAGYYHEFDNSGVRCGPFKTVEIARAAAVKTVEYSVASALQSALFGE